MELTILMPCLNEEKTIAECIKQAKRFIEKNKIEGEVLIIDNGSTDASSKIATECGARVEICHFQGYGNALRFGIEKAQGTYIIMGDCDLSYDFEHLEEFMEALREGYDLVIGNRMHSDMEKGAMSFSHRYIGVPFLSWMGRCFYHTNIKDFHCGLRGMSTEKVRNLQLKSEGMEFASEMIGKAVKNNFHIKEINIILHKDGRDGPSHLHFMRDGFRHLFLLFKR